MNFGLLVSVKKYLITAFKLRNDVEASGHLDSFGAFSEEWSYNMETAAPWAKRATLRALTHIVKWSQFWRWAFLYGALHIFVIPRSYCASNVKIKLRYLNYGRLLRISLNLPRSSVANWSSRTSRPLCLLRICMNFEIYCCIHSITSTYITNKRVDTAASCLL